MARTDDPLSKGQWGNRGRCKHRIFIEDAMRISDNCAQLQLKQEAVIDDISPLVTTTCGCAGRREGGGEEGKGKTFELLFSSSIEKRGQASVRAKDRET